MKSEMEEKRHWLLTELAEYVTLVAQEHGLPTDSADQLGTNVANFICEHFAGQLITFPQDYFFKLSARDLQIYEDWRKRMPWQQLVITYGMTEGGLRKVIKRVEKRILKRSQPGLELFPDDE
ncbi:MULTISPECIES: Mor transcription activator family protein [Serratia]|jgi:Mor family transcriptional regulator|uniref:Mor transcription activator family protein n=1 Tax=Serratia TaxID=613 RepID=UPI000469DA1F|nr:MULTISPECIES: Mor transcription activator family protein [Serratia]OKP27655.1 hypothetical protein BSQ40_15000 [Serratia fonticola]